MDGKTTDTFQAPDSLTHAPPPPYFEGHHGQMQPPIITAPPVQVQVVYATSPVFGHHSVRLKCPRCQADVNTGVTHDPSMTTHLIAVVLCFMCCLGCIPYCIDSCMEAKHQCPNCGQIVGKSSV